MSGQILGHKDLTADVDISCDVAIVGSGAGGAVLAAGLVERGLSVVIVEEGGHYTWRDFHSREAWSLPHLYQERGGRGTDDRAITILQGRTVGGTTTVNWTTCFRTPKRILDHWRSVHGVEGIDEETLRPHWEAVEARLNITEWPEERANANNQVISRGGRALGWEVTALHRNVNGCMNSGSCGLGCPVDGKQAMGITYLADALAKGLRIYANTRVERLDIENDRVVAIHGQVIGPDSPLPDGVKVTVRPKIAVSSAGAINGPALLLRSGLEGPVGKRTFLHPVVAMTGRFEEEINGWYGAPQSLASHQFIDRGADKIGFFLEVAPTYPGLSAASANLFGLPHQDVMADLAHIAAPIAICADGLMPGDEGGTVSLKSDGRLSIKYPIGAPLQEAFREAHDVLARLLLAAGAEHADSGHVDSIRVSGEADLERLRAAPYGALEHGIFTAHQMGGCAMGSDPERSVVDSTLRHRRVQNLFVVDGSVLPTSLGVNPSLTIYGLSHWAVGHVAAAI